MKKHSICQKLLLFLLCFVIGMLLTQPVLAEQSEMVEGFTVSCSKKGYCPGKGKYLHIRANINTGYQPATVRIRIYNKKGKYIFQKKMKNITGGTIDYKWNGKPGKKNEAKVSSKKYAKKGKYTAEVYVIPQDKSLLVSQKTLSFKIVSQSTGMPAVPILTGDPEVDYMAEQICKNAKIKDSLSDDEKVRLIYHWMTVHQKHTHYYEGGSYKTYYNLSSSAKKIKSYRKKTDKLSEQGELIYNYDYDMIRRKWCMERRIGVCTDHAVIFKILCNHVGIEAGVCSGYYLNRNGSKPPHSWNYAVINGVTWYYDVDVEIQNYGKGQGDYYWYKKNRAEANRTHQFVTIK